MNIENFTVIRCELGDIICTDMDDAQMTIACCDIKHYKLEKYNFDTHWNCVLKVIEKRGFALA